VSFLRPIDCPRCGAPLAADSIGASIATCAYCEGTLVADPRVVWASRYRRALAPVDCDVEVASVPYALEGLLAHGESCDVYLARRARTPTERVILKVPRGDDATLRAEWDALTTLHSSDARGAAHFTQRLPQLVARGPAGSVMRFPSGFVHTLVDVRAAHGDALDPRHAVWILRRTLELLGWVHQSGFVHGDVRPEHVLLHARDHGVLLVGWSRARRGGDPRADVAMSARCIVWLLGNARLPSELAVALGALAHDGGDAWAADEWITNAARAAFGPRRYVHLDM